MRSTLCLIAIAVLASAFGSNIAYAQQPVLQRGYDPGLSGANLSETTLTTSNVNPTTFGLVFTLPVDDQIYAQPLYVPQVAIAGYGTHNVVYIATMSDSLYAFDADVGGAPLWYVNFASTVGAVPPPMARFIFAGNTNIVGNLGILSTPVIDPSTNIMYVVACTLEGGTMVYRLHAVDITNGTEPYPNVVISGSHGGVTFNAAHQTQRVSLTLSGDQVVFGFGALQAESDDQGGYTGWVMAYNKQTLVQTGAFAAVTTGTEGGGVWQSGRPPAIDGAGFAYVFTGNGYQNGYNGSTGFSESALKLDPSNGLALTDWFTPSNWSALDAGDLDLSSSGPLLIPNTSPAVLAGGGKTGILYVLNTTDLGQYSASDAGVLQEESISASSMRGGPVYWQRSAANGGSLLYDWGTSDSVKAYPFNGTTFGAVPSSQGSASQIYPGGILALSANGELPGSGVLWATTAASGDVYDDATDPGVLYAFDADNVSTELWSSTMNSVRDNFGSFAKFVPPLVANGRVYVATFSDQVAVYGLLSPPPPITATPAFSLAPGAYTGTQQVALSDATAGATIYYTTNGTAPTISSAQYLVGTPLSISATETIEAMAVASGYSASSVVAGTYTISASGTPPGAGSVDLSTEDDVVGIGSLGTGVSSGGLDGDGSTYAGNLLGTSVSWSGSTFALGSAGVADAVSSTTIALTAGNYSSIQLLATAVNGNQSNQTFVVTYTDGTTTTITQSLSDWYTPQSYTGESIASTMAYRLLPGGVTDNRTFYLYGYSFAINSAKMVASITLPLNRNVVVLAIDLVGGGSPPPITATPAFSLAPGAYTGTQQVALSDATAGATIYYTTNGTAPTISSAQYLVGTPLSISATETIEAMAVASGYSASSVVAGTYTISASGTPPGAGSVDLSTEDDVVGIGSLGTGVSSGGLDGDGSTYAGNLLGTSVSWSGSTFALGSAGVADAVSSTTIALTAGNYSSIQLLATAVNGNQSNQTFVVTYTDGTTTTITQSLSDWYTPQSYTGESIASTMAYRLLPGGVTDNRTFYLYGYSFAINSAKMVASITLPLNRNVVVLAIDLVGGGSPPPITATPAFSLAPGAYTGTQQVALSDATAGATIYYTTNGTAPTISSAQYLVGTPLSISATETIEAMAVASGYSASSVVAGTYTISASGTPPGAGSVDLSTEDDVVGIGSLGTGVSSGGLDGDGSTYAGNLLGTSVSWSGSTFALGSAGVADAVSSTTIALTAGNYSSIQLLATAVNGNQSNQTFVVTYTDGTTTTITQSLSDWYTPQSYTGESIASTMAYRLLPGGVTDNRTFYLYGYSFAINSAKMVASITLPLNRNVVVLAIDLVGGGSPPPITATPAFSLAPGAYTGTQQVALSDATAGATIYYTTNGTAPTISSAQYLVGTPLSISATETIEAMAVASGYSASSVVAGTYTISASGTPPGAGSVDLSTEDDVVGIGSLGTGVSSGGLDGDGSTYAGNLLGTSVSWSGSTFALGSAGVADAVSSTTIALTAGNYSSIQLLATAVNGNQSNQTFVVTYTDGTTTTITQSLSDWYTPQSYTGESIASTMAYRLLPGGVTDNRTFYLYGYSFAINSAKMVASITLPLNRNVVVLAIDLVGGVSSFTVAPPVTALTSSQSQQFNATLVAGDSATWTVDGVAGGNANVGTINANGLYAAGSAAGTHTIIATSVVNPSLTGSAIAAVTNLTGVFTYHNDVFRDGVNSQEYALTPANVNTASFGKLFSCSVDGAIYAQPLWVGNLLVNGETHNVVFVATAHDSVYAFDADANPCAPLWTISLIDASHGATSGERTVPDGTSGYLVGSGFGDITPEVGVTGTPVIDPATGTLYVVGKSVDSSGTVFYSRLHAIDLATGGEKTGSPIAVGGQYLGTGDGGSTDTFNVRLQAQRSGLAFVNGNVYIAWASHEDNGAYYGWVTAYQYNGTLFTQTAIFNASPNQHSAGIWMGGGAPAADSSNNLYVLTGNGQFDVTNPAAPNNDYGDSLLQLTGGLVVSQYFTPTDQLSDDTEDRDFGSGGAAVLADLPGSTVPHVLLAGGKDGNLYVFNRDRLGGLGDSNAVQKIAGTGIFTTGAFWNNTYFIATVHAGMTAYQVNPSNSHFTLAAASAGTYGFPGSSPAVSAAGASGGIVWGLDSSQYCTNQAQGCGPALLHAYDAQNVSSELWNSSMVPADSAGNAVKFAVPTIANGKVYIGTRGNNTGGVLGSTTIAGELDVYGLKPN